jgi:hypothetical protein
LNQELKKCFNFVIPNNKKKLIPVKPNISLYLWLVFACSFQACIIQPTPEPPSMGISNTLIDIANIKSTTKSQLLITKTGVGTVSYTAVSDKSWLTFEKNNGYVTGSLDSLKLGTSITSKEITEGENIANVTITPTLNGIAAAPLSLKVKGVFKATALTTSVPNLNLGTLKNADKTSFSINKVGLEFLTFEASADQPWITIDKTSGTISDKIDIVVNVDPTNLIAGKFDGKITINPKVNGQPINAIVVPISGIYDDIITGNVEAHTLAKNEKWGGTINLNGIITVPTGKTLTINPGTKILVKKNPESSLLSIIVNGKLIMNGDLNNIIEIKSNTNTSNADWNGIDVNSDADISYVVMKNAVHALNFFDYSVNNNPQKPANIHHVYFDNNLFGLSSYKSNYEATFNNLTFNNIFYFSFMTLTSKKTQLLDCEFASNICYIDVTLKSDNTDVAINNCNFTLKAANALTHIEVIDGNKSVKVTANNCNLITKIAGFGINNNTFINTNVSQTPLKNIGCGFASRFPSGRLKYILPSEKLSMLELNKVLALSK